MDGRLEHLADGLWQIEADVPRLPIGRRMVIWTYLGGPRDIRQLRRLATPDVGMIVPGHGHLIREQAADVLRSIADTLDRG
ncbi:MAG: hypothetical protein JWO36_4278 [Myxococcales bacterium]|nr:hypothetical protein [Myxococcales bacterium]